jgi:hypothetical protein
MHRHHHLSSATHQDANQRQQHSVGLSITAYLLPANSPKLDLSMAETIECIAGRHVQQQYAANTFCQVRQWKET